jgi:DNA polymerase-3 subunit alpha
VLEDLKQLLERFPGDSEVVLHMRTASGERRLRLGNGYRVAQSSGLRAELDHLLGDATLSAA